MTLFLQSAYLSSLSSLVYIAVLYRSHPFRRLPVAAILVTFTLGMLTVIPVVLLNRLLPALDPQSLVKTVVVAPAAEELVKMIVFLLTARRLSYPTLIEPLDWAILFGVLGVGFGVYEDFWYIFGHSYPSWISGDHGRFVEVFRWMMYARSFPGHLLFNTLAGFLLGWGIRSSGTLRWSWVAGAYVVAVGSHSLFNLAAGRPGTLLLWSVVILGVGGVAWLRKRATADSPFRALPQYMRAQIPHWTYDISPVDVLFAEGYAWPGKPSGSFLAFYPVTLSLVVLFPLLVSCVYFAHRLLSLGLGG